MDSTVANSGKHRGLLANGSSRLWEVAVDEDLACDGVWTAEFDGNQLYLGFQLRDLKVIPEMLDFLRSSWLDPTRGQGDSMTLGSFGTTTVSLVRDGEPPRRRCFFVLCPQPGACLRVSLEAEDIETLIEALQQVAADLVPHPGA
jgi:hypothetical protein